MKTTLFATMITLISLHSTVHAQSIKEIKENQKGRIEQGVKTGELTQAEANALVHQQKDIRNSVKEAKMDDGKISACERASIKHEQNQASRNIYRAKHNGRDRF